LGKKEKWNFQRTRANFQENETINVKRHDFNLHSTKKMKARWKLSRYRPNTYSLQKNKTHVFRRANILGRVPVTTEVWYFYLGIVC
jgi:hypothetical protein